MSTHRSTRVPSPLRLATIAVVFVAAAGGCQPSPDKPVTSTPAAGSAREQSADAAPNARSARELSIYVNRLRIEWAKSQGVADIDPAFRASVLEKLVTFGGLTFERIHAAEDAERAAVERVLASPDEVFPSDSIEASIKQRFPDRARLEQRLRDAQVRGYLAEEMFGEMADLYSYLLKASEAKAAENITPQRIRAEVEAVKQHGVTRTVEHSEFDLRCELAMAICDQTLLSDQRPQSWRARVPQDVGVDRVENMLKKTPLRLLHPGG